MPRKCKKRKKKNCKQIFFAFLNVDNPKTHLIKAPNSLN